MTPSPDYDVLEGRIGQEFDGELHLTEEEGRALIAKARAGEAAVEALAALKGEMTAVRCMAENSAYNLHQMGITQETASPARAFEDIERTARTALSRIREGEQS